MLYYIKIYIDALIHVNNVYYYSIKCKKYNKNVYSCFLYKTFSIQNPSHCMSLSIPVWMFVHIYHALYVQSYFSMQSVGHVLYVQSYRFIIFVFYTTVPYAPVKTQVCHCYR